jgi:predicted transcriptional regulator
LNREQRREREEEAYRLRLKGWTQRRIAKRLDVSQTAVLKMTRRVENRLVIRMEKDARRFKVRQTAQLEHVVLEALGGWERSKRDAEATETTEEATTIDGTEKGDPVPATTTRTKKGRKGQSGDAAKLRVVLDALGAIRQLWGLNTTPNPDDAPPPMSTAPGIAEIRREILAVLEAHPEARAALARRLMTMETNDAPAAPGH